MKTRKILSLLVAVAMLAAFAAACGSDSGSDAPAPAAPPAADAPAADAPAAADDPPPADSGSGEVTLTLSSWRPDDAAQWDNILAAYKEVAPNVTIRHEPINPPDYNATLRMQLEGGTGPDLYFSRSYATGDDLFNSGFMADVSNFAGVQENFSADALDAWTVDGHTYAVPIASVSHGVYYNKTLFAAHGLGIPDTWDTFINICETLLASGITPLANGVADEWDILECFFLGMLPNYVGGSADRAQYESGSRPMNDQAFIDAYTDFASIAKYLPNGFEATDYNGSAILFEMENAAMLVDGSWQLGVYENAPFDWGIFAIPARNAADTAVCVHVDLAVAMNSQTAHPAEAQAFLEWLASPEGAAKLYEHMPIGFIPLINANITLDHPQANEFVQISQGKVTDVRFVWPELIDLYGPMNAAVISLLKGDITPQEAGDNMVAAYNELGR